MTNSDGSDPRRGPRRYGPSAGSPAGSGRPPVPPTDDDFDDSTTVYPRQDGTTSRARPPGAPGLPAAAGSFRVRVSRAGIPGSHADAARPAAAGRPRPAPAWSQTNPPTAKFPSYPEQPARPTADRRRCRRGYSGRDAGAGRLRRRHPTRWPPARPATRRHRRQRRLRRATAPPGLRRRARHPDRRARRGRASCWSAPAWPGASPAPCSRTAERPTPPATPATAA